MARAPGRSPNSLPMEPPLDLPSEAREAAAVGPAAAPIHLAGLGAELAYIQDATGRYHAFHWREAAEGGLDLTALLNGDGAAPIFRPANGDSYYEQLQRVLLQGVPERWTCPFVFGDQERLFELSMTPILTGQGRPDRALVIGQAVAGEAITGRGSYGAPAAPLSLPSGIEAHQKLLTKIARSIRRTLPLSSALYQILLTKIARNIRTTLDLETIWRQTVWGLGQALSVSRCVIFAYPGNGDGLMAVAEYVQEGYSPMKGQRFRPEDWVELRDALDGGEPVSIAVLSPNEFGNQSGVAVSTHYQNQPNAVICLYQCDRERLWSGAEIDLMRELAEQVGTAIAHATLFSESQKLANELQRKNISQMKKQQELEEARRQAEEVSQLKSEFLANTSHEIRTPLNGVIGFLQLILDGMVDEPEEQEEFIREAHKSAVHLLEILNDILDIARIEANKLEMNLQPVRLKDLLENTEKFTQAQVQAKGLYFEIPDPESYENLVVYGDYQRLLQVMLNLTGNALKFTHDGGVTLSAEIIRQPLVVQKQELPGLVRIRVADTGIGVSLDKQDRLFQVFSQVDGARTRRYGGTGLGLAISRKLVEAMGGEVNFYSLGDGLGSTVTFTVPLYEEPILMPTGRAAE
ncbi:MAG: ATP-binding protein [Cyanobacteria bacterium]|nr:ATP-binding protein [Cyanobacteriota bacterium]